jgi:site-specific DNA-methyltransferase (cytosine-N4-specific)
MPSSSKRDEQTKAKGRILPAYETEHGRCFNTSIEEFLASAAARKLYGKVSLIFTSPPFPLASPKKYGNLVGEEYLNWITGTMRDLLPLLKEDGSLVVEIGNAWDKGSPTMSTLPLKTLLAIAEQTNLNVCQQFIWENSARLPGPATWVNKERIRLKDSHTHVWWYSQVERPKANNRNVLVDYSPAMKRLIKTGKYNHGTRPSEHVIGEGTFATDNRGAIPGSTIIEPLEVAETLDTPHSTFVMGNTSYDPQYREWCRENGLSMHPARMPIKLAELFIKFLTEDDDLVLDPFGGSNTTGRAAENLGRQWVVVEKDSDYVKGSRGRFLRS